MEKSMSIVPLLTILFLELLAMEAINISFCSGSSDVGFIHRRTLNADSSDAEYEAYEQPKMVGIKQLPWKNLQYLDLRSNLFEGPVPVPPPSMKVFLISNNNLTGEIPRLICNTSTIEVLDLSNNTLSGTIPECLGHFSNSLRVLDLQKNMFHGKIPGKFAKGNDLRTLNFNGNGLEGPVPKSLVNCTRLEVLDLGNNNIYDTFPQWLGTLPELQVLVLRSNRFHGSVSDSPNNYSFSKLRIFDLSNNYFSGSLPARHFENMKSMMSVGDAAQKKPEYMGDRYYDDSVTLVVKKHEVKLVKILTIFSALDFSNNSFHGQIPEIIGKLQSLNHLNLSQNSLIGHIPPSLSNLRGLESLDLSSNKLDGRIPWQLINLTFLSILNLSQNQLIGPIPLGYQFGTFSNDSYSGNLGLCGFPLTKKCSTDEPSERPSTLEDDTEYGKDFGFGWEVVLMGYGCGTVFGMIVGYLVFLTRKPQWLVRIVEGKHHKKVRRTRRQEQLVLLDGSCKVCSKPSERC